MEDTLLLATPPQKIRHVRLSGSSPVYIYIYIVCVCVCVCVCVFSCVGVFPGRVQNCTNSGLVQFFIFRTILHFPYNSGTILLVQFGEMKNCTKNCTGKWRMVPIFRNRFFKSRESSPHPAPIHIHKKSVPIFRSRSLKSRESSSSGS